MYMCKTASCRPAETRKRLAQVVSNLEVFPLDALAALRALAGAGDSRLPAVQAAHVLTQRRQRRARHAATLHTQGGAAAAAAATAAARLLT